MAESQVTIDNTSHDLGEPFMVIATQNPLDSVGTYPLPQARWIAFYSRISMKHIARECELQVMRTYGRHQPPAKPAPIKTTALVRVKHYIQEKIHLSEAVESCLLDIAEATRTHTDVILGLSTRALVAAMSALKAYACLQGRAYVIPDDIVTLAPHLFGHRLTVKGGAEQAKMVLNDCIQGSPRRDPRVQLDKGINGGFISTLAEQPHPHRALFALSTRGTAGGTVCLGKGRPRQVSRCPASC